MKILFIYRFLTLGGVETVLKTRLEGFQNSGVETYVWFLQSGDGKPLFDGWRGSVGFGRGEELELFLKRFNPNVVSCIDTYETIPVVRSFVKSASLIVESHTPYRENLEYLRHLSPDDIHAVLVPSEFQRIRVRKRLNPFIPIRVVPNPLGKEFEKPITGDLEIPARSIVAWLGRLDSLKNWRLFVDIAGGMQSKNIDVEYWIAGRPPDRKVPHQLYSRIVSKGLVSKMRWFRNLPHPYVPRFLDLVRASGGVYICTSKGDSFGMSVAEAMARACAVLAPNMQPFSEFIEQGITGEFYSPGSKREAISHASKLLESPRVRTQLGISARERILADHANEAATSTLLAELKSIHEMKFNLSQPSEAN